jgi:tetratricopeptide (TPR) repeat protein
MKNIAVVFLLLLLISVKTYSQNCECELINETSKPVPQKLVESANIFCKAKGYELLASDFLNVKELDSAEFLLKKSELLYKQSACKEEQQLPLYKQWSSYFYFKAEYQPALEYSFKMMNVLQIAGTQQEYADVLLNISQIFGRMGQPEKGLEYCRKAIPVIEKMYDGPDKSDMLNKTGSRFYFFYQDTRQQNLLDTASSFFQQGLLMAKKNKYINGMQLSYNKMNSLSYQRKNYLQALLYIDSAIALAKPGEVSNTLATSFGDKGHLLLKMGNYNEAARWADSCLYYFKKIKFPPLIANAYSLVAEISDSLGDHQKAYLALYNEKKITDSLNNVDKISAVNEVEKKYNQAKNEKTIKELAQEKKIYLLIGIAGLLAAVLIGFYFRQQSLKQKQKILETEQRLNRARMNPHFFFNALTAMQRFALKENDGKALASNLSKFSNIMRETLESSYKEYVTVKQEVEFLKEYMEIQKMRFPELFTYSLMLDGEMEPSDVMIPSMIIQPFIENSIEHGFADIDYPGIIRVDFKQQDKIITIEITDNGKGLSTPGTKNNEHISRASQIIKDRIYLLNIKLKTKADFSIDNNKEGKGVIVKIHLPVIYANENTDNR